MKLSAASIFFGAVALMAVTMGASLWESGHPPKARATRIQAVNAAPRIAVTGLLSSSAVTTNRLAAPRVYPIAPQSR